MYIENLSLEGSGSSKNQNTDVFFEFGYEVYKFGLIDSIMLKVLYYFIVLSVPLQRNTDPHYTIQSSAKYVICSEFSSLLNKALKPFLSLW